MLYNIRYTISEAPFHLKFKDKKLESIPIPFERSPFPYSLASHQYNTLIPLSVCVLPS